MIDILITFAIVVVVILLAYYLLKQLPLPGEAWKFINIAIVVIVAVMVIWLLLAVAGQTSPPRLR